MASALVLPPGPTLNRDEMWRLEQEPSVLEEIRHSYGDLFTLHRPSHPPRVCLSTPRHFRNILLRHDQQLAALGPTIYNDLIGPHSMLKLAGIEHRRIRQTVTPLFAGTSLQRQADTVHALITQGLRDLAGRPPQPLARAMIRITARIMNSFIFPNDLPPSIEHALEDELVAVLNALHDARTAHLSQRAHIDAQYHYHRDELDRVLLAEIARTRMKGDPDGDSLLSALLSTPRPMADHIIRDQIVSVLTGGTTTAGNGISMALYWLYHRSDVAARVSEEVHTLPEDASAREIASLPYLSAVCTEALRIPTVTPTSAARRVDTAFTAEGFHFSQGTHVIVAIHLAHHHEPTYPDHAEFRPERFLNRRPAALRYLPFGIGSHYCLGAQLTELEMRLAVAAAVRLKGFDVLGADERLRPRSHGVNLTTPHTIRACLAAPDELIGRKRQ